MAEPVSFRNVGETLMECCDPGAIHNEELVAYLEGERVRPEVVEHLARCQSCTAKLRAYQALDHKLINRLYRWDCPPGQVLGEYHLGMLENNTALAVATHVQTCVLCAAELVTLTEFVAGDVLAGYVPALAPVPIRQRKPALPGLSVSDLQRVAGQLGEQAIERVRRVIATLVPPSPSLAYQRAPVQSEVSWPRNYMVEDINISLQSGYSYGRSDRWQLLGFVTRGGNTINALQGVCVQLTPASAGEPLTQYIDDLGNFVFATLSAQTYTLEIQLAEQCIVIENIQIQSQ